MNGLTVFAEVNDEDRDLVITPGKFEWGELVSEPPIAKPDVTITFGKDGQQPGPWGSNPWPVADGVFAIEAPKVGSAVLVGGSRAERAEVIEKLSARGVQTSETERLTLGALISADVVGILGKPRAPLVHGAFATLAAGRLLVMPPASPAFGLQAGVDHLVHSNLDDLVHTIDALASHPKAWAPFRALGRQVAESQRASVVIGRVARRLVDGW